MDNQTTIREQIRAMGGDAMVASFDEAQKVERQMVDQLLKVARDGQSEVSDRKMAMIASCEALSEAYARTVVETFNRLSEDGHQIGGPSDVIVTTIKSLIGNLNQAFEDSETEKAGIGGMIRGAFDKLRGKA